MQAYSYIWSRFCRFTIYLISASCRIYATANLVSIGPDNGLSPGRRQAIAWTNADLFIIGSLGTNFSEIGVKIQKFPIMKMHLKMSSAKWWPFFPGGDELIHHTSHISYLGFMLMPGMWVNIMKKHNIKHALVIKQMYFESPHESPFSFSNCWASGRHTNKFNISSF